MDFPAFNLDTSIVANRDSSQKPRNSVDPDETARHEPSHLDLHFFHKYLFWSTGPKGFRGNDKLIQPENKINRHIWFCIPLPLTGLIQQTTN